MSKDAGKEKSKAFYYGEDNMDYSKVEIDHRFISSRNWQVYGSISEKSRRINLVEIKAKVPFEKAARVVVNIALKGKSFKMPKVFIGKHRIRGGQLSTVLMLAEEASALAVDTADYSANLFVFTCSAFGPGKSLKGK
jgi:hypothetical protein